MNNATQPNTNKLISYIAITLLIVISSFSVGYWIVNTYNLGNFKTITSENNQYASAYTRVFTDYVELNVDGGDFDVDYLELYLKVPQGVSIGEIKFAEGTYFNDVLTNEVTGDILKLVLVNLDTSVSSPKRVPVKVAEIYYHNEINDNPNFYILPLEERNSMATENGREENLLVKVE